MGSDLTIHGEADEGYGAVADAFRKNFREHGEIGAAVSVYEGARPVVDLWAGHRDRKRSQPWERDTIVPVFSTTKGIAALTIAVAQSAGLLDYDERVATYWPEFAANGKADVTVRQLIEHQAGLSGLSVPLRLKDLADLDALADVLAAEKPAWKPGTRYGYHAISLGHYQGELIRRVDPARRSLGRYFAEEIAAPLGLDFYIGFPEDQSMDRVAELSPTRGLDVLKYERAVPFRVGIDLARGGTHAARALTNPNAGKPENASRRSFLTPEMPASNGVGTARAIARAYGAFAGRTGELPVKPATLDLLAAPAAAAGFPTRDLVLHVDSTYHLGFRKSNPAFPFGSPDHLAYGTTGLGGSHGFADPTSGIGFGYVMNRLGLGILTDRRPIVLERAVMKARLRR